MPLFALLQEDSSLCLDEDDPMYPVLQGGLSSMLVYYRCGVMSSSLVLHDPACSHAPELPFTAWLACSDDAEMLAIDKEPAISVTNRK